MLRLLREEKGSAIAIVAISMTVMIGFAALIVDVGNLYLNKIRLSNMADAAALAGVQDLPSDPQAAVASAYSYAAQNGINSDVVGVTVSDENRAVIVSATRTVPLFFAPIFNMTSSNVTARAKAKIMVLSGTSGIAPFGIVKQEFKYSEPYTLKEGAGTEYRGNFAALALGASGSPIYQNNIKYGYKDETLYVGKPVPTEPGNMSGPTAEGVDYRMKLDPDATFETAKKSSGRIVIVPIIESLAVSGRNEVVIAGFAAFFLEGVGGSGKNNYVTGRFLQMVVPGDISNDAVDYGLYSSTLIE